VRFAECDKAYHAISANCLPSFASPTQTIRRKDISEHLKGRGGGLRFGRTSNQLAYRWNYAQNWDAKALLIPPDFREGNLAELEKRKRNLLGGKDPR